METRPQGSRVVLATFVLALFLSILPLPDWVQGYRPQWVALTLIYWCLAVPQRVGVGWACCVGLVLDVLVGTLLGQHALSLSVVAYLTLELHQRIRVFPLWQQSLSVLVLLWVERLLTLWIMGATGQPTPTLWYWVPSMVSMLCWPGIYHALRGVRRRFQVA